MTDSRQRLLTAANVEGEIDSLMVQISDIGRSISGKVGLPLLTSLKRDRLGHGPYGNVSLFEAANRIMSDLVILHGVRWLLSEQVLPYQSYTVEYGNEDNNGFDLVARSDSSSLCGEAFNVARSFFQTKKTSALKKLREKGGDATHRILLVNHDALSSRYRPKIEAGISIFAIDVLGGKSWALQPFSSLQTAN